MSSSKIENVSINDLKFAFKFAFTNFKLLIITANLLHERLNLFTLPNSEDPECVEECNEVYTTRYYSFQGRSAHTWEEGIISCREGPEI